MSEPKPDTDNPQDWSDLIGDATPSDLARALLAPDPVPEPDDG